MKFSALLCLYHANQLDELKEALDSTFVHQTTPPSELVVVFDGPVPEEIGEYIESYTSRVTTSIVRFPENRGHGPARAAGIEACRYDWVAIVDADDISLPNRFEILLGEINAHPDLAVVGGGLIEFVDEDGARKKLHRRSYPTSHSEVKNRMRTRSPVAQPTAMLRRSAILDVGNYQNWYNNEDYHLWIRLVSRGYEIRNAGQEVLLFRTSHGTYQRRGGLRYWWNESRLQLFSLRHGTTTLPLFLAGAGLRFVVQVLLPNSLRAAFYKRVLRSRDDHV